MTSKCHLSLKIAFYCHLSLKIIFQIGFYPDFAGCLRLVPVGSCQALSAGADHHGRGCGSLRRICRSLSLIISILEAMLASAVLWGFCQFFLMFQVSITYTLRLRFRSALTPPAPFFDNPGTAPGMSRDYIRWDPGLTCSFTPPFHDHSLFIYQSLEAPLDQDPRGFLA